MKSDVLKALANLPPSEARKLNHNSPWTEERVALLRRLKASGLSSSKIAKALSMTGATITRNAVIAKCDRLGLTTPKPLQANRQKQATNLANHQRKPAGWRAPKEPALLKSSPHRVHGAERGDHNTRFIDIRSDQCQMFVGSESGALGLVCGLKATHGKWCEACASLVYVPTSEAA